MNEKPPCCVLKDHMAAIGRGFPFAQQLSAHMCGLVDLIMEECGDDEAKVSELYKAIGQNFYLGLADELNKRKNNG